MAVQNKHTESLSSLVTDIGCLDSSHGDKQEDSCIIDMPLRNSSDENSLILSLSEKVVCNMSQISKPVCASTNHLTNDDPDKANTNTLILTTLPSLMPTSNACLKISDESDRLGSLPQLAVSRFETGFPYSAAFAQEVFHNDPGRKACDKSSYPSKLQSPLLENKSEHVQISFGEEGKGVKTNVNSSKCSVMYNHLSHKINTLPYQSGIDTNKNVTSETFGFSRIITQPTSGILDSFRCFSSSPQHISCFNTSDSLLSFAPRLTSPCPRQLSVKKERLCNEQELDSVLHNGTLGTNTLPETNECPCIMCYKRKDISDEKPGLSSVEPVLTEQETIIIYGGNSKRKKARDHEKDKKRRKCKQNVCQSSVSAHAHDGKEEEEDFELVMSRTDLSDDKLIQNIKSYDGAFNETNKVLNETVVTRSQNKVGHSVDFVYKSCSREKAGTIFKSSLAVSSLESESENSCSNLKHNGNRTFMAHGLSLYGQLHSVLHIPDSPKFRASPPKVFLKPTGSQLQKGGLVTTVPISSKLHRNINEVGIKQKGFARATLSTTSVSSPIMAVTPASSSQLVKVNHILLPSNQVLMTSSIDPCPSLQAQVESIPQIQQVNNCSWKNNHFLHDSKESMPPSMNSGHQVSCFRAGDPIKSNSSETVHRTNSGNIIIKVLSQEPCEPQVLCGNKPHTSTSGKNIIHGHAIDTSVPKTPFCTPLFLRNSDKSQFPHTHAASVSALFPLSTNSNNSCISNSVSGTTSVFLQSELNLAYTNSTQVHNQSTVTRVTSCLGSDSAENSPRMCDKTQNQENISHICKTMAQNTAVLLQPNLDTTVDDTSPVNRKENKLENVSYIHQRPEVETDHLYLPQQRLSSSHVADWVSQAQDYTSKQLNHDVFQEHQDVGKSITPEMSRTSCHKHIVSPIPLFHPNAEDHIMKKLEVECSGDRSCVSDNSRETLILPRFQRLKMRESLKNRHKKYYRWSNGNKVSRDQQDVSSLLLHSVNAHDDKSNSAENKQNPERYVKKSETKSSSSESALCRTKSTKISNISTSSVVSSSRGIKLRIRLDHIRRKKAKRQLLPDPLISLGKYEHECHLSSEGKGSSSIISDMYQKNEAEQRCLEPCSGDKLETAEEMFQRFQEQAVQEVFKAQLGVGHVRRSLRPTRPKSFVHRYPVASAKEIANKVNEGKRCEDAKRKDDCSVSLSLAGRKKSEVLKRRQTKKSLLQTKNLKISIKDYPQLRQDNSITNRKKVVCSNILAGHKVYVKFNTFENMVSGRSFLVPFFNLGGSRTQFDVEDMEYLNKAVIEFERDEKSCARHLLYHFHKDNKAAFLRKESLSSVYHLNEKNYKRSSFILEGYKRDTLKQVEIPLDPWKIDNHVAIEIDRAEVDNDAELEFDASGVDGFEMDVNSSGPVLCPQYAKERRQSYDTDNITEEDSVTKVPFECIKLKRSEISSANKMTQGRVFESDMYTEKLQEIIRSESKFGDEKQSGFVSSKFAGILPEKIQHNLAEGIQSLREETWMQHSGGSRDSFIKQEKFDDEYDERGINENSISGSNLSSIERSRCAFFESDCSPSSFTIKDEPFDHYFDFPKQKIDLSSYMKDDQQYDVSCSLSQSQSTFLTSTSQSSVGNLDLLHLGDSNKSNLGTKFNGPDSGKGEELHIPKSKTNLVMNCEKTNKFTSVQNFVVDELDCMVDQHTNLTSESEVSDPEFLLSSSSYMSESSRISSSSDAEGYEGKGQPDSSSVLASTKPSKEYSSEDHTRSKITFLVESLKQRLSQDLPPWLNKEKTSVLHSKIRRKKKTSSMLESQLKPVEKISCQGVTTKDLDTTVHVSPCASQVNKLPLSSPCIYKSSAGCSQSPAMPTHPPFIASAMSVGIPVHIPPAQSNCPERIILNGANSPYPSIGSRTFGAQSSDKPCKEHIMGSKHVTCVDFDKRPIVCNQVPVFSIASSSCPSTVVTPFTNEKEMNLTDYCDLSQCEAKSISTKSPGCMESKKIENVSHPESDIEIGTYDHPETSLTLAPIMPVVEQLNYSLPHERENCSQKQTDAKGYLRMAEAVTSEITISQGNQCRQEQWSDSVIDEKEFAGLGSDRDSKQQCSHLNLQNIRSGRKCPKSKSKADEHTGKHKGSVAEYLCEKFSFHEGTLVGHKIRGPRLLKRAPKNNCAVEQQTDCFTQERFKSSCSEVTLEPISTIELSRSPTISEIFGIAIKNEVPFESSQRTQEVEENICLHQNPFQVTRERVISTTSSEPTNDSLTKDSLECQNAEQNVVKNECYITNFSLKPCQVVLTRLECLNDLRCKIHESLYLGTPVHKNNQKPVNSVDFMKSADNVVIKSSTETSEKMRKIVRKRRKKGCRLPRKSGNKPKQDIVEYYESVLESLLKKAKQLREEELRKNEHAGEKRKSDPVELATWRKKTPETDCIEEKNTDSKQAQTMDDDANARGSEKSKPEVILASFNEKNCEMESEIMGKDFNIIDKKDGEAAASSGSSHGEDNIVFEEHNFDKEKSQLMTSEAQITFSEDKLEQVNDSCMLGKSDLMGNTCMSSIESMTSKEQLHENERELSSELSSKNETNHVELSEFDKKDILLGSSIGKESVLKISANEATDPFAAIENENLVEDGGSIMSQIEVGQLLGLDIPFNVFESAPEPCDIMCSSNISTDVDMERATHHSFQKFASGDNMSEENGKCSRSSESEEQSFYACNARIRLRKSAIQTTETKNVMDKIALGSPIYSSRDKAVCSSTSVPQEEKWKERSDKTESIENVIRQLRRTRNNSVKKVDSEGGAAIEKTVSPFSRLRSTVRRKNKHISMIESQSEDNFQLQDFPFQQFRTSRGKKHQFVKGNKHLDSETQIPGFVMITPDHTHLHQSEEYGENSQNVCDSENKTKDTHTDKSHFTSFDLVSVSHDMTTACEKELPEISQKVDTSTIASKEQQHDGIFSKLEILQDSEKHTSTSSESDNRDKLSRNVSNCILKMHFIDINKLKTKLNPLFAKRFRKTGQNDKTVHDPECKISKSSRLRKKIQRGTSEVFEKDFCKNSGFVDTQASELFQQEKRLSIASLQNMDKLTDHDDEMHGKTVTTTSNEWNALPSTYTSNERDLSAIVSSTVEKLRRHKGTKKIRARRKGACATILSKQKMEEAAESKATSLKNLNSARMLTSGNSKEDETASENKGERSFYDCLSSVITDVWEGI